MGAAAINRVSHLNPAVVSRQDRADLGRRGLKQRKTFAGKVSLPSNRAWGDGLLSPASQARQRKKGRKKIKVMGMSVYGENPDSARGEHFRRSIWRWHPLWDYCQSVAPAVTKKVANGHTNDSDGLDDDDALALASILRRELDSGRTEVALRDHAGLESLPYLPDFVVDMEINQNPGALPDFPRDLLVRSRKPLCTEDVREFCEFLEHCGGFAIW